MRLIVGLGNPGPGYADTRHNAGFLLADALRARFALPVFRLSGRAMVSQGSVAEQPVALIKPLTYMNRSGLALQPWLAEPGFDPAHALLVLVDDVALPLGSFRLRARGSAGGHHGLESIEQVLGSQAYPRLRIGIGPLPEGMDLADFDLAPFSRAERAVLEELWPTLGEAVECWIREGIEQAMNRYNRLGRAG